MRKKLQALLLSVLVLTLSSPAPAGSVQFDLHATVTQTSGGHTVTLSWTASTDAAANPSLTYNVYRATGDCSSTSLTFGKLNSAPISGVTFANPGVQPGVYCYYVTAFLNGAESVPSTKAPAVILPSPPTAVLVSAT
jgi:hypothetical protein